MHLNHFFPTNFSNSGQGNKNSIRFGFWATLVLHIIIAVSDFRIDCVGFNPIHPQHVSRSLQIGALFAWRSSFPLIRFHLCLSERALNVLFVQ